MARNDLMLKAGFYHSLGMNITCLKGHEEEPKSFKDPVDKNWEQYFSEPQSMDYVLSQDWENATGIGLVLGYNGFRAIDIDKIRSGLSMYFGEDLDYYYPLGNMIKECLALLKLPSDYDWVVKSGSGSGLHIIFKTKEIEGFDCRSWAFGPDRYDDFHQDFERFELRWKDHLVLSPSKHISGEKYEYVWTDFPTSTPMTVEIDDINNFINEYSLRPKKGSYTVGSDKRSGKYISYKRGEDIGGSWGSFYCDVEDNYLWLRECHSPKAMLQLGVCYMFGKGGAEKSDKKAVDCFKRANIPQGYYNLAYLMATGCVQTSKNEFEETLCRCSKLLDDDKLEQIREMASKYMKIVSPPNSQSTSAPSSNANRVTLLFFDTETTGLPLNYNAPTSNTSNWPRMVQLSWIVTSEKGEIIKKRNYIIRPEGFSIPQSASNLHGITTERALRVGISISTVLNEFIVDLKKSLMVIGHNVDFDKKIVGAEMLRLGRVDIISTKKSYCTMNNSVNFCKLPGYHGEYKYPKLQELYRKLFGQSFSNAHDASADTEATMKCYFELKKKGL